MTDSAQQEALSAFDNKFERLVQRKEVFQALGTAISSIETNKLVAIQGRAALLASLRSVQATLINSSVATKVQDSETAGAEGKKKRKGRPLDNMSNRAPVSDDELSRITSPSNGKKRRTERACSIDDPVILSDSDALDNEQTLDKATTINNTRTTKLPRDAKGSAPRSLERRGRKEKHSIDHEVATPELRVELRSRKEIVTLPQKVGPNFRKAPWKPVLATREAVGLHKYLVDPDEFVGFQSISPTLHHKELHSMMTGQTELLQSVAGKLLAENGSPLRDVGCDRPKVCVGTKDGKDVLLAVRRSGGLPGMIQHIIPDLWCEKQLSIDDPSIKFHTDQLSLTHWTNDKEYKQVGIQNQKEVVRAWKRWLVRVWAFMLPDEAIVVHSGRGVVDKVLGKGGVTASSKTARCTAAEDEDDEELDVKDG